MELAQRQPQVYARITTARVRYIQPFVLRIMQLALTKIDFAQDDMESRGIGDGERFIDCVGRLLHIFLLQVDTGQARVGFRRLRLLCEDLLILLECAIEIPLSIKRLGFAQGIA
jgi:hypothetical protein